jgi:hypothetical protein
MAIKGNRRAKVKFGMFLNFLKLFGILISGLLGIIGTITETRNRKTRKLTTWGRWVLALTIGGLMIALSVQMFEISEQDYNVQRAISSFRSISGDICFRIPIDSAPEYRAIAMEMTNATARILSRDTNPFVLPPIGRKQFSSIRVCTGLTALAHSNRIDCVMMQIRPNFPGDQPGDQRLKPIWNKLTASFLLSELPPPTIVLVKPGAKTIEYATPGDDFNPALNGNIILCPTNQFGILALNLKASVLELYYHFESCSEWHGNKAITSIRDLDNASCQFWISSLPEPPDIEAATSNLFSNVEIPYARISFDDLKCSFSDIKSKPVDKYQRVFKCKMPHFKEIMDGKAESTNKPPGIDAWLF